MKQCTKCKFKFPDHLVNDMAVSVKKGLLYIAVCPMCALEIMNSVHDIKKKGFTSGSHAQELLIEAQEYFKKQTERETK